MEGRLSENKQKLQLSYQVNTEAELKTWLNFRGKGIELTAEGEFISPAKKRNLYNFDQEAYFRNHRISGRFQIQRLNRSPCKITGETGFREKEDLYLLCPI